MTILMKLNITLCDTPYRKPTKVELNLIGQSLYAKVHTMAFHFMPLFQFSKESYHCTIVTVSAYSYKSIKFDFGLKVGGGGGGAVGY